MNKKELIKHLTDYGLPKFLIEDLLKDKKIKAIGGTFILEKGLVYKVVEDKKIAI